MKKENRMAFRDQMNEIGFNYSLQAFLIKGMLSEEVGIVKKDETTFTKGSCPSNLRKDLAEGFVTFDFIQKFEARYGHVG